MTCDRCGASSFYSTCSMFNTQTICPECEAREKSHPLYEKARKAESAAVLAGNLNYEGIGLPPELERRKR
jgi:uncharacterized Zn finger protein (UPF0148 family)